MPRASRRRCRALQAGGARAGAAALLALLALAAMAGQASAQQPTPAPPRALDGPSADIVGLGGLSIARDGTGGLAYVKNVSGVGHVFVSRLAGGVFQAPEEIGATLSGASSQPVVAAANGGLLLVAFVNGGQLYVVDRASTAGPYTAPAALAAGASNPAISISTFGKAYLAFTASGAGGHDVRSAYYYNGRWGVEASPLDAAAGDDAGTGTGRPAVTAAGDGVGIVAWGEAGHVYTRRVWATAPSIVYERADPPALGSWSEASADEPAIGAGGDSSYATVAFHEGFSSGSSQQSRVLAARLHGSRYDGLVGADGLATPGAEGSDQPGVAVGEYGSGLVTSGRDSTHQLVSMQLGQTDTSGPIQRVDSLQNSQLPDAVPTVAGYHAALIAWQQTPGALALPEIRARYYDGSAFDPEFVVSTPTMGPTDASRGLYADGDIAADIAIAWVQGTAATTQIVTDQLYQPPGSFAPTNTTPYIRTPHAVLTWSAARDLWGPVSYTVTLDGSAAAQTTATTVTLPSSPTAPPLAQGSHSWQVTATNPAGLTRGTRAVSFFLDTVAPVVTMNVTGKRRVGSAVRVTVQDTDAPPPLTPAMASGIASVVVDFGDGNSVSIQHSKFHVYHQPGTYTVNVTVTDKAGNTTKASRTIRVKPKPKPKPKRKPRKGRHG